VTCSEREASAIRCCTRTTDLHRYQCPAAQPGWVRHWSRQRTRRCVPAAFKTTEVRSAAGVALLERGRRAVGHVRVWILNIHPSHRERAILTARFLEVDVRATFDSEHLQFATELRLAGHVVEKTVEARSLPVRTGSVLREVGYARGRIRGHRFMREVPMSGNGMGLPPGSGPGGPS